MHDDEGRPTRPPFENVPLGITLALPLVGHARTLRGVLDHEAQTAQAVADGVGTAPILRGAGVGTGRQQGVHGLGGIRAFVARDIGRQPYDFASFVRFISSRVSSGEGMSWAFCSCQSRFFTAFSIRHSAAPASARRSSEKSSGLR